MTKDISLIFLDIVCQIPEKRLWLDLHYRITDIRCMQYMIAMQIILIGFSFSKGPPTGFKIFTHAETQKPVLKND